jgi:hypothetical protein
MNVRDICIWLNVLTVMPGEEKMSPGVAGHTRSSASTSWAKGALAGLDSPTFIISEGKRHE